VLKLTYSNLEFQNFPGEDPRPPLFKGREGEGREEREGKRRDGKGQEGRDGKGQEGRNGGGEGTGGALDMGSAPLETSSGSAPVLFQWGDWVKISKQWRMNRGSGALMNQAPE